MSALLKSAVIVVTTLAAAGVASAQGVTCQNAQYSPEIMNRFPNIRAACLDVITKDGQPYAVVKGELDRVYSSNSVGIRIKKQDGTYAQRQTLKTKPDAQVMVKGKPVRVSDLATGQELTAYVRVSEPVMALAPADDSSALETTPIVAEQQVAQALPETASLVPLMGLAGGASLLFGIFLGFVRNRRR